MNLLVINPYDYKTVQSNPGLLSFLQVLATERISYAMTVTGSFPQDGFRFIEMPDRVLDADTNYVDDLKSRIGVDELTHIIAIDPEGAMVAMRLLELAGRANIKYSYISYEILFADEIVFPREQKLKEFDLAYLRLCSDVLIQDEVRGRVFSKEAGREFHLFYAPVSPLQYRGKGSGDHSGIKRALGLPLDKKILIYSGSMSPYAKHDWWIRIAEILPDEYIFLFTCYDGSQLREPILARIGKILTSRGNVYFVGKELPAATHLQVLQACDAGIAFFRPIYTHWMSGRNIRDIGLSSGKFSTYISCGLPVICDSDQEIFRKLAADYPVVQTIFSPDEIPAKLKSLSEIRADSNAGCKKLFDEVLNPYVGIKSYLNGLR
jgi:glycosyltransferase involved in cell wall biosynthesis